MICPGISTESLLVNACESMVWTGVMLAELAVSRALDDLKLPQV